MNEILHANIFFVIASIATVIFCMMVCVILYHVIKITKSIRSIVERVEAGSEAIAGDIEQVREYISSGRVFSRIIKFFMGASASTKKRRTKRND
jgi:hypothetical protein